MIKSRFQDPGGGYRAHTQTHKDKHKYDREKERMIRLAVKIPEGLKKKARKMAVKEIGENNLNAFVRYLLNEKINQK